MNNDDIKRIKRIFKYVFTYIGIVFAIGTTWDKIPLLQSVDPRISTGCIIILSYFVYCILTNNKNTNLET